jgi:hypothetical protein
MLKAYIRVASLLLLICLLVLVIYIIATYIIGIWAIVTLILFMLGASGG